MMKGRSLRSAEERECYLVEAVLPRVCSYWDMLANLRFPNWVCDTGQVDLAGFGGIIFWRWAGDTADENRLPVKLS